MRGSREGGGSMVGGDGRLLDGAKGTGRDDFACQGKGERLRKGR